MGGTIWYYAKDNQQQGPVSEDELRQLFASSQLPPETLVWTQGLANWTAASEINVFVEAMQAKQPPPLPPQFVGQQAGGGPQYGSERQNWKAAAGGTDAAGRGEPVTLQQEQAHPSHAATMSPDGSDLRPESNYSWQQSAAAEGGTASGGYDRSLLDAIPTPGSARTQEPSWDRSAADAIATPNAASSQAPAWDRAALDSIPTPGAASANPVTPSTSDAPVFDRSALDAIPTPGSAGGGTSSSFDRSALDSIPTPKVSRAAAAFNPSELDSIPTPRTSTGGPIGKRAEGGQSSLRADPASSSASLLRGDTGSHQQSARPSLSDLRQSSTMRNAGVSQSSAEEQPSFWSRLRASIMRLLGREE